MTVQRLSGIGYCARLNRVGDWAFEFAARLAGRYDVRLNIFIFPDPPCRTHAARGRHGEKLSLSEEEKVEIERRVRLYYDDRLGDLVNVGFRLCEGDEDPELRRCLLMRKEYDLLVLAYEFPGCPFGERPIEEFAERMACPTVLIGPERSDEIYLNAPATLWTDTLGLDEDDWLPIVTLEAGE